MVPSTVVRRGGEECWPTTTPEPCRWRCGPCSGGCTQRTDRTSSLAGPTPPANSAQTTSPAPASDLVPGFWNWLEQAHHDGRVFIVQQVAEDINAVQYELSEWLGRQPASFRIAPNDSDRPALAQVPQWAQGSPRYTQGAVNTFLAAADYFLVAQAMTRGYTVVTGETVANPDAKARIKIPDACTAAGVECISLFQMLKREGASFR